MLILAHVQASGVNRALCESQTDDCVTQPMCGSKEAASDNPPVRSRAFPSLEVPTGTLRDPPSDPMDPPSDPMDLPQDPKGTIFII